MFKIFYISLICLVCVQNFVVQASWLDQILDYCNPIDSILQQFNTNSINYGTCRKTTPQANFNPLGLLGKWYVYEIWNFGDEQADLMCLTNTFVQDGNNLNFSSIWLYKNGTKNIPPTAQFPIPVFQSGELQLPNLLIQVVYTDYTNLIVWHSCMTEDSGRQHDRVIVATRSRLVWFFDWHNIEAIINDKVFNNTNPVKIIPYGRCKCLTI